MRAAAVVNCYGTVAPAALRAASRSRSQNFPHAAEAGPVRRVDGREARELCDPAALVVADDRDANLAMTPRYGLAPRTHGRTTILVAALRWDGLSAAMTVEGAMDRLAVDVLGEWIPSPTCDWGGW